MDYREKVGNDDIDHMNFINENGEEEDFKIICHGGWDEEEEEPVEEVSKYEEYDDEYGKVKVNKVSKFKGNKDKFNSNRVESKFIKSNNKR